MSRMGRDGKRRAIVFARKQPSYARSVPGMRPASVPSASISGSTTKGSSCRARRRRRRNPRSRCRARKAASEKGAAFSLPSLRERRTRTLTAWTEVPRRAACAYHTAGYGYAGNCPMLTALFPDCRPARTTHRTAGETLRSAFEAATLKKEQPCAHHPRWLSRA
jgi:hypothetical protein